MLIFIRFIFSLAGSFVAVVNPEFYVKRSINWRISSITPELAEKLHLQIGDAIVAINQQNNDSFQDLYSQILVTRSQPVTLMVSRDKQPLKLEVTILGDLRPLAEESRLQFQPIISSVNDPRLSKKRITPGLLFRIIVSSVIVFLHFVTALLIFKQKRVGYHIGIGLVSLILLVSLLTLQINALLLYVIVLYLSIGLNYRKTFLSNKKDMYMLSV